MTMKTWLVQTYYYYRGDVAVWAWLITGLYLSVKGAEWLEARPTDDGYENPYAALGIMILWVALAFLVIEGIDCWCTYRDRRAGEKQQAIAQAEKAAWRRARRDEKKAYKDRARARNLRETGTFY